MYKKHDVDGFVGTRTENPHASPRIFLNFAPPANFRKGELKCKKKHANEISKRYCSLFYNRTTFGNETYQQSNQACEMKNGRAEFGKDEKLSVECDNGQGRSQHTFNNMNEISQKESNHFFIPIGDFDPSANYCALCIRCVRGARRPLFK